MALNAKRKTEHRERCQAAVDALARHGTQQSAADSLGVSRTTIQAQLVSADRLGIKPTYKEPAQNKSAPSKSDLLTAIPKLIRRVSLSLEELTGKLEAPQGAVLDAITELQGRGVSIHLIAGRYEITLPPQGSSRGRQWEYKSRKDGSYLFGVVADSHLCSKHERLDVLNDLYDKFAAAGVDRVFHCGNYIDGEARFNKHELLVHGMDAQCQYLAKHYPKRKGITTYAVSGDDHEGWYAQREGVNIGGYAENVMRENGRTDWVDIGYISAYVTMTHAKSGAKAMLEVCHPGGGSAYADSYAVQKIIEALEGGEKPAIWLGGHYHKMISVEYRNVWAFLCGCTKDLDTFGKKKKLRYVIGGAICEARQNPDTGAIEEFTPRQFRYFNRGYYNDRWSHSGGVVLPERGAA